MEALGECVTACASGDDTNNLTQSDRDRITDGLKQCVTLEKGQKRFMEFIDSNRLGTHHKAALVYWTKCESVLNEADRLSPPSRLSGPFPQRLNLVLEELYDIADDVNFDSGDLNRLSYAMGSTHQQKLDAIKKTQEKCLSLLEIVYETFRKKELDLYKLQATFRP